MSWMDSWSRPSKSQATPAPYYLLPGGESTPYCHSCGRVIGNRKTNAAANSKTPVKYCSSHCKVKKPGKVDREIEAAFVKFLTGEEDVDGKPKAKKTTKTGGGKQKRSKHAKGDPRILVACSTVENFVFGADYDDDEGSSARSRSPESEEDHEPDRPRRPISRVEHDGTVDTMLEDVMADRSYIDGDVLARMSVRSGTRIRPPQSVSEVNGSVGGEKGVKERIEETGEMLEKRRLGQKRANEKEMVKCAARRLVVHGVVDNGEEGTDGGERRFCEAVMAGKLVEPSFAKGDWSIRWRE